VSHIVPAFGIVVGHPPVPITHVLPSHVHGMLGPLGDVAHWHDEPRVEHIEPSVGAGEGQPPAQLSVQSYVPIAEQLHARVQPLGSGCLHC
jgi:hypothetical protein